MTVIAGRGGDGAVAFRREKFGPFGGPAGGDGGNAGSVIFVGSGGKATLGDLTHSRILRAENGQNGQGSDCNGRSGKDHRVQVPLGTIVFDLDRKEKLGEVTYDGQELIIAKGGKGGRGNIHFATSVDRAPRRAEQGTPGAECKIRLELKVMADVGLLGFPNVGKSTFISAVSRAKPKVADYPFTTLAPHLGMVEIGDSQAGLGRNFVIADIPGLIPGASDGQGLGARFLRHVERTRVLLHLVTIGPEPDRDVLQDYALLRKELELFDPALAERAEVVALSQSDRPEVQEAYPELKESFQEQYGVELHLLSAVTRHGLTDMLNLLWDKQLGSADDE